MLSVTVTRFQRTKDGPREMGLMVVHGVDEMVLLDYSGTIVEAPVWDYKMYPHAGCVNFDLDTLDEAGYIP